MGYNEPVPDGPTLKATTANRKAFSTVRSSYKTLILWVVLIFLFVGFYKLFQTTQREEKDLSFADFEAQVLAQVNQRRAAGEPRGRGDDLARRQGRALRPAVVRALLVARSRAQHDHHVGSGRIGVEPLPVAAHDEAAVAGGAAGLDAHAQTLQCVAERDIGGDVRQHAVGRGAAAR